MQTAVVRWRLIADREHQGGELAPQLCEKALDGGCRQTLVGVIDHRIGDVVVRRKERGIFPAQVERLLEKRNHRGEVVCQSSPGPGIVGSRAMDIRARYVLARDPDGSVVIAPHDADQDGIVGGSLSAYGSRRSISFPSAGSTKRSC